MVMNEENHKACIAAVRARVELLPIWRGNPPLVERAGLVSARTVLDRLARRYLSGPASWQDDAALVHWYAGYCLAFTELSEAMQDAVRGGALSLRSEATRAPLRQPEQGDWLDRDCLHDMQAVELFPNCAGWAAVGGPWPDSIALPPGALKLEDAEAWCVGAGITEPGELAQLLALHDTEGEQPATTHDQARNGAPLCEWTGEQLKERQSQLKTELKAKGRRNYTEALAEESGLSKREITRRIKATMEATPFATVVRKLGT
jgi:hypothetical protein